MSHLSNHKPSHQSDKMKVRSRGENFNGRNECLLRIISLLGKCLKAWNSIVRTILPALKIPEFVPFVKMIDEHLPVCLSFFPFRSLRSNARLSHLKSPLSLDRERISNAIRISTRFESFRSVCVA